MSLTHPEWVDGRRIWMDGSVRELMNRIRFGDPLLGWEGDEAIELYFNAPEERFELWRLEDDGNYRRVCRSQPGMSFDERIIHALVQWDGRRRPTDLATEVNDHNARRRAELDNERDEWLAEEIAPRLKHAMRKEL